MRDHFIPVRIVKTKIIVIATNVAEDVKKGNTCPLFVGMQASAANVESSELISSK